MEHSSLIEKKALLAIAHDLFTCAMSPAWSTLHEVNEACRNGSIELRPCDSFEELEASFNIVFYEALVLFLGLEGLHPLTGYLLPELQEIAKREIFHFEKLHSELVNWMCVGELGNSTRDVFWRIGEWVDQKFIVSETDGVTTPSTFVAKFMQMKLDCIQTLKESLKQ